MDNKDGNDASNEFEKNLQEINEWQKNANNPGYFIGSGKVPVPIKNIFKSSIFMLIVGLIFLVPTIYSMMANFNIYNITGQFIPLLIGIILFVGGVLKFFRER